MNSIHLALARSLPRRGRTRRVVRPGALVVAAFVAFATPAAAQATRVAALPARDVFAVRVVGDTIAAATDTVVFVSTNGGVTWRASARPAANSNLIVAVVVRNGRMFAGTFGTGVFASDDLGATWHAFNEGLVGGFLNSQLDINDLERRGDSLMAATAGAGVYVRDLAGGTWHLFGDVFEPDQASNVNDLALGGTRMLACAGANGMVFDRDPGTPEWTESFLSNVGLHPGTTAQSALFTGTRWVVGTNQGVFSSVAGQEPWTLSSTHLTALAWSTFASLGGTVFAAFDSVNTILMGDSHDQGATWTIRQRVSGPFAYQLVVHASDLYIARSDGLFVQSGAVTSVPEPRAADLRLTLAGPQPVRDAVRLRFDMPVAGVATLEVFDVSGRRVAGRITESWPPGRHPMTVDASTLPPGVYAARLTTASASATVHFVRVR